MIASVRVVCVILRALVTLDQLLQRSMHKQDHIINISLDWWCYRDWMAFGIHTTFITVQPYGIYMCILCNSLIACNMVSLNIIYDMCPTLLMFLCIQNPYVYMGARVYRTCALVFLLYIIWWIRWWWWWGWRGGGGSWWWSWWWRRRRDRRRKGWWWWWWWWSWWYWWCGGTWKTYW